MSQLGLNPARLIFIDETWAKTNMTRSRGQALIGERLIASVPHGHWKTTTLLAGLDQRGIRCSMVIDGAINTQGFEAFVKQVLTPTLRPGDVVIMDNLSSHKSVAVHQSIESAGSTRLYLPPYLPDLNPIELAFSKLKQLMRSAGHRTIDALWNDVQRMLDHITQSDANHFFQHCKYTLQVK